LSLLLNISCPSAGGGGLWVRPATGRPSPRGPAPAQTLSPEPTGGCPLPGASPVASCYWATRCPGACAGAKSYSRGAGATGWQYMLLLPVGCLDACYRATHPRAGQRPAPKSAILSAVPNIVHMYFIVPWLVMLRSYHHESTRSHQNSEVKRGWARLVLG
jgi:hypothetical protein